MSEHRPNRKRSWKATSVRLVLYVLTLPVIVLLVRAFDARTMPDLKLWHRIDLVHEFRTKHYIEKMTFEDYLSLEGKLFAELDTKVYDSINTDHARQQYNRYIRDSLSDPNRFSPNWNRTFELVPEHIQGGVLLLHGLTDSPYSLRSIAQIFYERGYYVLCPRMPGHGTVPAALTTVKWQDWMPVVNMAAHHVRQRIGNTKTFYLGGYSNGGALAVKYALNVLETEHLEAPDKIYLFSPAIGVTRFAVFANWHQVLSFTPYFEKFKWQSIEPEFDPFKYNSFPKNAGDQTYLLSMAVQAQIDRASTAGLLSNIPPMITFQSVVDSTVVGADLVDKLYEKLPPNKNQLITFDVNRCADMEGFFKPGYQTLLTRFAAQPPSRYELTIVTNVDKESLAVVARTLKTSSNTEVLEPLDLEWPFNVYSLSHVALPFPPNDSIYGNGQGATDTSGFSIGTLEPRGEKGLLRIPAGQLLRLRHNPFFEYMRRRIAKSIREN